MPAVDIAAAVRAGERSARSVVEEHLAAIDVSSFTGPGDTSLLGLDVDQGWVRGLATTADARLAVLLDG